MPAVRSERKREGDRSWERETEREIDSGGGEREREKKERERSMPAADLVRHYPAHHCERLGERTDHANLLEPYDVNKAQVKSRDENRV